MNQLGDGNSTLAKLRVWYGFEAEGTSSAAHTVIICNNSWMSGIPGPCDSTAPYALPKMECEKESNIHH